MVFSSLTFLYIFLPLCLIALAFARNNRQRNPILLVFSLIFYAWGEPIWVIQMIVTGLLAWGTGIWLARAPNPQRRRGALTVGVVATLLPLLIFKYGAFFMSNINALFGLTLPVPTFSLPLGISFYTFQVLTYCVDLYRGEVKLQRSFANFLLYEALFPQLVAGPIVRYGDVAEQIEGRELSSAQFSAGVSRMICGLAKKVLLANPLGEIVRNVLESGRLGMLSGSEALIGLFAFGLQIYYDFSGYSDMAIGMGHMLGFRFLENFRYPYTAGTITEFWRRWHISLGTFFRDYVYIPLGGNRRNQVLNLTIVWFLTGFWHGASWNFILWGLYFLVFLLIEKFFLLKLFKRIPKFMHYFYSLPVILFGWALFKFTSLTEFATFVRRLFCVGGSAFFSIDAKLILNTNILLLIAATIGALPFWPLLRRFVPLLGRLSTLDPKGEPRREFLPLVGAVRRDRLVLSFSLLYSLALLILSTAALVSNSFNPFLYFRF